MIISIAVQGAPYDSTSAKTALRFAEAALRLDYRIHRVFFHHGAVLTAASLAVPPQEEEDVQAGWVALHEAHGVELALCITNALKRGLVNEQERIRYDKAAATIHAAFTTVGLGELIDAMVQADRFITFAA